MRGAAPLVRDEHPGDVPAIAEVHARAFGQPLESRIVDALRAHGALRLSLVATIDDVVVGHIAYSPVEVPGVIGVALGPMAVLPEHQRRGVGGRLVEAGTARLLEAGCPFVLVLGHPGYYPRFGFEPAGPRGIRCAWDVPDDVFMVMELRPGGLEGVLGLARYRPEFSDASE